MSVQPFSLRLISVSFGLALVFSLATGSSPLATALLAQQPQTHVQQAGSGLAPSVAAFPNLSIASGNVLCGKATATYAGGQVTTLQNGVNYVYFDCGTSVPKSSTSPFAGGQIPLAVVVARSGSYGTSGLLDVRPWAVTRTEPTLLVTAPLRGAETRSEARAAGPAADPAPDPTYYNVTTLGGTIGKLPVFSNTSTEIEDSAISQNSGNIGVNTTTPNNQLDVNGGINAGGSISFNTANRLSTGVIPSIPTNDNGAYVGWLQSSLGHPAGTLALISRSSVATDMSLYTGSTSPTERMTISSTGNVGIGTTSPSALFSVGSGSPFQVNTGGGMTATAGQTLSGGLTENGGPTYSLSGGSESGNTVTFTTTTTCGIMAGQVVTVSSVTPTDYNGTYRAVSGCGGGTSFTVLNPESGLGAGSGGTATASPLFNFGMSLPSTLSVLGDNSAPGSNPFGVAMVPLDVYSYRTTNISGPSTLAKPQVYIGRTDNSQWGTSQCANLPYGGPAAACDEPLLLVMGTNGTTGYATPALVAIEGYVYGGASNANNPDHTSNFHVGGVFRADDASTPNTVNLRGINVLAYVSGYPNNIGPGNFTRSAAGIENDVNNSSGHDAVFGSTGGTGNFLGNYSAVSLGGNNLTSAYGFASSSSSGIGWLTGIAGSGAVNCGLCLSNGNEVTTTTGIHLTTGGGAGTYGMVVGSGTQTEVGFFNQPNQGNPNVGILLDAQGTAGTSETQNSNSLVIRAKTSNSTGTDWTLTQSGTDNMLDFKGPAVASVNHSFVIGDSSSRRVELGYGGTNGIAGATDNQAKIIWGQVGSYAGDLLIGSRGNYATNIALYTAAASGGLSERVRINSAGNVGVGTTSPALQLQVSKAMGAAVNSVSFSATPTFDASKGNTQTVTLTGQVTSSTLSNCQAGQWLVFDIIGDGNSGHTFAWPSYVHGGGTIDTGSGHHNRQMFYCDGTNSNQTAWSVAGMVSVQ